MHPIRTKDTIGIYGAPKNFEEEIGGLPYSRQMSEYLETSVIYSVWEPSAAERAAIAAGANLLVAQIGEPIRPMSIELTDLKKVEESAKSQA